MPAGTGDVQPACAHTQPSSARRDADEAGVTATQRQTWQIVTASPGPGAVTHATMLDFMKKVSYRAARLPDTRPVVACAHAEAVRTGLCYGAGP